MLWQSQHSTRLCSLFTWVLLFALSGCGEAGEPPESFDTEPSSSGDDASEPLDVRPTSPSRDGSKDAPPSRPLDASAALDAKVTAAEASSPATRDAASSVSLLDAASDGGVINPTNATDAAVDGGGASAERTTDFAVGTLRIDIATDGGRTLPVQIWYPAADSAAREAEAGHPLEDFEAPGPRRELLKRLIRDARPNCPNLTMHAALNAAPYPRTAPFPLLVYSHHFSGSRFTMFTIAEALAREGMVVAAPDHVNGSLFERKDPITDSLTQFTPQFLRTRSADLRRVLDVLLDAKSDLVPTGLRGRFDAQRVGAVGHSLGGITVGIFSVEDTRVRASAYLAIIPSAALLRGLFGLPDPKNFRTPALYLTAQEDATVDGQGGPAELAANYEAQPLPAYWIDVRDAGHFSFGDDCGLVPEFDEGCGTGRRVTNGMNFTYLDAKRARQIAAHYTAAFFAVQFLDAAEARLTRPVPPALVTVKQRGAKAVAP